MDSLPPLQQLMITSHLILFLTLILLLIHFSESYKLHCTPSACGIISHIKSPLRLKGDPNNCGYSEFELSCENNVTSISLNSHKYYVKAINYHNSTIRLVDASLNNHDLCSFPTVSAYHYNFTFNSPYHYRIQRHSSYHYEDVAWPINLISCPHPLKNSSLFTEITTHCASNSFNYRYSYIKAGHVNFSEVPYTCRIDLIVMTSWIFKDLKNVSLIEIHQSLLYGFELYICTWCIFSSLWGENERCAVSFIATFC